MAAGNRHLGYKDALNAIEVQSPGTKHAFYFGFLERGRAEPRHGSRRREGRRSTPCVRCGAPALGRDLQLLPSRRSRDQGHGRERAARGGGSGAAHRPAGPAVSRDAQGRRRVPLPRRLHPPRRADRPGRGHDGPGHEGPRVHRAAADARRLRAEDAEGCPGHLPEGPRADPARSPTCIPGARVLESGVGSGALSLGAAAGGRGGRGLRAPRGLRRSAQQNVEAFAGADALEHYRVEIRDCYEGIDEVGLDRIVLDLPEPWQVVKHAERVARARRHPRRRTRRRSCRRSQLREALAAAPFIQTTTIEVLHRSWHIDGPVGQARSPDGRAHGLPDFGATRRRVTELHA